MSHTSPPTLGAWRTDRNVGHLRRIFVSSEHGLVRVGGAGFRLRISPEAALELADELVDAVELIRAGQVNSFADYVGDKYEPAHSFREQLEQAITATPDSEVR